MKKIYYELILFLLCIFFLIIKDLYMSNHSKKDLISFSYSYEIKNIIDDYEYLKKINNIDNFIKIKCIARIKNIKLNYFYEYYNIYNGHCKIKKHDLIISENGLIGIVYKVNNNSSIIRPLSNHKLTTSIIINNKYGTLNCNNGKCFIKDIDSNNISVNDKVYTSGLSYIPKNLLVGYVKGINNDIEVTLLSNNNPYVAILGDVDG